METKICSKCKKVKLLEDFCKDKSKKDGLNPVCRECASKQYKQYYLKNKDKINKRIKEYRKKNSEKVMLFSRKRSREWYKKNQEYAKQYSRNYYEQNKEKEKARCQRFFDNNPEYRKIYSRKWKENHPDYEKEWLRNKRENSPAFRLSKNISRQMRKAINRNKDGYNWENIIGYTLEDLIKHLEKQFKDGMNWDNYGKWHIDHIRPISSFNFNSYDDPEFKKCWALENLQPLWAEDNIRKHNKILMEVK
jgi:hypothetical protein